MSRTVVRSSLCLAVVIALLLPAAYAVAGKGGGIPLIVALDPEGGLRGDNIEVIDEWSIYINGDSQPGASTVLRVQLISNSKTLALDTRGAGRKLLVDFGTTSCPEVLGLTFSDGCVVETEALFEVLLSQPFTSLTVPTSGVAKLWFTMGGSDWRVDWPTVRVTSIASGAWQVEAMSGGLAGLSKLSGKRTKPGTIGTEGWYNILIFGLTELQ